MKKILVFFACIVLLLIVSGCSQPQSQEGQPSPSPTVTITRMATAPVVTAWTLQPQTPTPSVSDNTISIQKMAYNPSSLTVKKGSIVRWVNTDTVVHTVTFTKESGINPSGPLSASQSFSVKFDEAGTYPYSCAIHPGMQGTVVVV